MKSITTRIVATAAASLALLFSAGCDKASQPGKPQASAPPAPAKELNAQGLAFAKLTYLDDLTNAIQDNNALTSMEDGLKILRIDLRVDAKTYANDYEANEIAADNKYKGKKILLIGVINSINKDIGGNGYLALRGPGMFQDVQARLSDTGMEGAATLSKGNTVYLVCDHGMKIVTMTTARNCQRYSQHLEVVRPDLEKSITAFMKGVIALPNSQAQAVASGYVIGSELPPGSPCLTDINACAAEFTKITSDKARQAEIKGKVAELLKSLKTT